MPGWKTYLTAIGIGVVAAVRYLGWISPEAYEALMGLLAGAGFAALRAGIAKVSP